MSQLTPKLAKQLTGDDPKHNDGSNLIFQPTWKAESKAVKPGRKSKNDGRRTVINVIYRIYGVLNNRLVDTTMKIGVLHITGRTDKEILKDMDRFRAKAVIYEEMVDQGVDPRHSGARKATVSRRYSRKLTFGYWAIQLWKEYKAKGLSESSYVNWRGYLVSMIRQPWFWSTKIESHTPDMVLRLLKGVAEEPLNKAGYEGKSKVNKAHRMLPVISDVYKLVRSFSDIELNIDPTEGVKKRLPPEIHRSYPKLTQDYDAIGELLLDIDEYYELSKQGYDMQYHLALSHGNVQRLQPFTLARGGQLPLLEWTMIDFKKAVISKPMEKVRKRDGSESDKVRHFYIPITDPMMDILIDQAEYSFGKSKWVFPQRHDFSRHINPDSTGNFYRDFKNGKWNRRQTAHGWRGIGETVVKNELTDIRDPHAVVNLQLSHMTKDAYDGAYDEAFRYSDRRDMMEKLSAWLLMAKEHARAGVPVPRKQKVEDADLVEKGDRRGRLERVGAL